MWIVARLIVLVGGFYLRYLRFNRNRFNFNQSIGTLAYAVHEGKHKGRVVSYWLAVAIESDAVFKIQRENQWNKLLKDIGFAAELQTGDIAFDGQYYIGSDHFHFNQALRSDPVIRKLIHDIIVTCDNIKFIECDGRSLFVESKTTVPQTERVVQMLHSLAEKIKPISQTSKFQAYKDPFIAKLLIFESVILALTLYAVEALFEHVIQDQYVLDSPWKIFLPGIFVGLSIVGILLAVFYKYFRESARGHIVMIGNFLFLLFGSPFWGTKTFVDLNQLLDQSPVSIQRLQITHKEVRVHRSRKGGRSYTYHWHYNEPNSSRGIESLKVTQDVYNSAEVGDNVEIKIRNGAFDYPYRISINNIEL